MSWQVFLHFASLSRWHSQSATLPILQPKTIRRTPKIKKPYLRLIYQTCHNHRANEYGRRIPHHGPGTTTPTDSADYNASRVFLYYWKTSGRRTPLLPSCRCKCNACRNTSEKSVGMRRSEGKGTHEIVKESGYVTGYLWSSYRILMGHAVTGYLWKQEDPLGGAQTDTTYGWARHLSS